MAGLLNVGLARKTVGVRDVDYWNWKHEQNPFGRSLMWIAKAGDQVVGIRALMRWELMLQQQRIPVAKPVDSVTHPDFQRRGIFSRLTLQACQRAAEQGVGFLFNTPNNNSKPGYLKLGWRELGGLPVLVKIRRPLRAAGGALRWKTRGGEVPAPESFFKQSPLPAATVVQDQRLGPLLAERAGTTEQLETHRTPEFLRWRYGSHPHIPYYAETLERPGRPGQWDAMLFYRTNFRQGIRELMITDLIVRQGAGGQVVPQLLRQLQRNTQTDYWALHVDRRAGVYAALRACGFFPLPGKRIPLVARTLEGGCAAVPDLPQWSLCCGDLEGL